MEHATVCLVGPNRVSILCQSTGVMGVRIPFFLMPNGLAAVVAAAGFAPASPAVVDMLTEGRRKLSCQKSRTKKLSPLLHAAEAGFSRRQAVGIALGDKDTVSELFECAAECAQSRLDAIGWSEFSATKVPTFFLTALEGRGEIAGISRLHPQFSVHIFTLPSFNAHAGCRRAGRNSLQVGPHAILASQAVGNMLLNASLLCYLGIQYRTVQRVIH